MKRQDADLVYYDSERGCSQNSREGIDTCFGTVEFELREIFIKTC